MDKDEKLLDEIIKEIASFFSSDLNDLKEEIISWGKEILKIRLALKLGSGDLEELKRTESYAWVRVLSLKAKYEFKIEKKSWELIERLFKLIKNAFLFG